MERERASGLPFVPWLARLGAYVLWFVVALPVVGAMVPGWERWTAAALLAVSGVLLGFFLTDQRSPTAVQTYLAVQTVLLLAAYALRPDAGLGVAQLFFLLAAQAVLFLPWRAALPWVALFTAITFLGGLYVTGRPGLLAVVATAGGNAIFAGLAAAVRQTQLANRRVHGLLQEVREAHERLRALNEATQQLAVAQERERIAREMHDALGHRLTVAVVQLEGARRLIPTAPDRAAGMVDTMREQLKEGLAELRETVAALRSPVRTTLTSSLEGLATAFETATGIEVHVELPEALPELDQARRHALYRVAQEGLTNVQRHAGARAVWLSIEATPDAIALWVSDDGRGYPHEVAHGRFGLEGIAERIAVLGGRMELGARPGGGARLGVHLPLDPTPTSATPIAATDDGLSREEIYRA